MTGEPSVNEELFKDLRWFLNLPKTSTAVDMQEHLRKLIAALGGDVAATSFDALSVVQAMKTKADGAESAVAAAKSATPDPAQFVPIAVFQQTHNDLVALKAKSVQDECNGLIETALKEGRLLPYMKDYAVSLAKSDPAKLKDFISILQPIAALTATQTGGKPPSAEPAALGETELAVCKSLGLTAEQFNKAKPTA